MTTEKNCPKCGVELQGKNTEHDLTKHTIESTGPGPNLAPSELDKVKRSLKLNAAAHSGLQKLP